MKFFLRVIYFLSIGLLFTVFSYKIFAQDSKRSYKYTLGVSPAYTEIVLDNSEYIKRLEFTLTNRSKDKITVHLYPLDIRQVGEEGKIQLLPKKEQSKPVYKYGLAKHITLDIPRFELASYESKTVTVTIHNEDSLSPGGHYAAVVSELEIDGVGENGPGLLPGIVTQIFSRKIGGEKPTLELLKTSWPVENIIFNYPKDIRLLFQNKGNIHLVPYGKVEVKDMFSRVLYTSPINESSAIIFPEQKRNIAVSLKKNEWSFPISYNKLTIDGFDSLHFTAFHSEKAFFYINPVIIIVLILILFLLIKFKRKISSFLSKQRLIIRKDEREL